MSRLFTEGYTQTATMDRVREWMATKNSSDPFTEDEIEAGIQKLTDANKIMVSDGMVFLI